MKKISKLKLSEVTLTKIVRTKIEMATAIDSIKEVNELGEHAPISVDKELNQLTGKSNGWQINKLFETDSLICFTFSESQKTNWGYYNKLTKQSYIASNIGIAFDASTFSENSFYPISVDGKKFIISQQRSGIIKVLYGSLINLKS